MFTVFFFNFRIAAFNTCFVKLKWKSKLSWIFYYLCCNQHKMLLCKCEPFIRLSGWSNQIVVVFSVFLSSLVTSVLFVIITVLDVVVKLFDRISRLFFGHCLDIRNLFVTWATPKITSKFTCMVTALFFVFVFSMANATLIGFVVSVIFMRSVFSPISETARTSFLWANSIGWIDTTVDAFFYLFYFRFSMLAQVFVECHFIEHLFVISAQTANEFGGKCGAMLIELIDIFVWFFTDATSMPRSLSNVHVQFMIYMISVAARTNWSLILCCSGGWLRWFWWCISGTAILEYMIGCCCCRFRF